MSSHTFYPAEAGHRGVDTSVAAADGITPSLGRLQASVHEAVNAAGPDGLTTNEIALQLGVDRGSIQPRTSELRLQGLIGDSRQRRQNENGKSAIVWVAADYLPVGEDRSARARRPACVRIDVDAQGFGVLVSGEGVCGSVVECDTYDEAVATARVAHQLLGWPIVDVGEELAA